MFDNGCGLEGHSSGLESNGNSGVPTKVQVSHLTDRDIFSWFPYLIDDVSSRYHDLGRSVAYRDLVS